MGGNQTVLIFNFLEPGFLPSCPQKGFERETLFMPYFPKTERPDKDAESFYREFWDRLTEKKGDGKTTVFLRIKKLLKWKKKR